MPHGGGFFCKSQKNSSSFTDLRVVLQVTQSFHKNYERLCRNIALLLALAFLSSCDAFCGLIDCGCIEADDFGEYQQTS